MYTRNRINDIMYGQNWVDQFAYNLGQTTFSDASGLTLSEIADTFGLGLVNESFQWDSTPQGGVVWYDRHLEFVHVVGLIR